ncbi:DapH/DapD/GlmU-related protein [uncultured Cellulomonas sp.]|uniref:acyltransferase n=1 Tax=uncultured Cellulomonas sp. TaxID=189682 RepID=UPI00260A966F|nr:DapH/DapD/GlmU-related protein [uncultured Cellulomonas sp.]
MSTAARDLLVNGVAASALVPNKHRWRLLRAYGLTVEPCTVAAGVWIGSRTVTIGRGAYVNRGVMLDGSAPIRIGARVYIGFQATIITSSHDIGGPERRAGAAAPLPVVIGDGAWIGAAARILPGVTIGAGAVVAAGAVVTKDVAAHTVVAGVPATTVRELGPAEA